MGEVEERRSKGGSGKVKGRKGEGEETEKGKNSRSKESSGEMGDIG